MERARAQHAFRVKDGLFQLVDSKVHMHPDMRASRHVDTLCIGPLASCSAGIVMNSM